MSGDLRRQSHGTALALFILLGFAAQGNAGLIIAGNQAQHVAMGSDPNFQANGWLAGYNQQGETS